jgi:hypothetical protein
MLTRHDFGGLRTAKSELARTTATPLVAVLVSVVTVRPAPRVSMRSIKPTSMTSASSAAAGVVDPVVCRRGAPTPGAGRPGASWSKAADPPAPPRRRGRRAYFYEFHLGAGPDLYQMLSVSRSDQYGGAFGH